MYLTWPCWMPCGCIMVKIRRVACICNRILGLLLGMFMGLGFGCWVGIQVAVRTCSWGSLGAACALAVALAAMCSVAVSECPSTHCQRQQASGHSRFAIGHRQRDATRDAARATGTARGRRGGVMALAPRAHPARQRLLVFGMSLGPAVALCLSAKFT